MDKSVSLSPGVDVCSYIKENLPEDSIWYKIAEKFKTLSDPTRLKIVHLVVHQELKVCEIADILNMSLPAVSYHLKQLKLLNLIEYKRKGKNIYYCINNPLIKTLLALCMNHVDKN